MDVGATSFWSGPIQRMPHLLTALGYNVTHREYLGGRNHTARATA